MLPAPMYATRSHVRATLFPCAMRCLTSQQAKRTAASAARHNPLEAQNELARKLQQEGVWILSRSRRKGKNTDKYRVNVVSEQLCDDIVNYIKPTLARHEGCDLIDIFPGSGLWSQKLNDVLKPRSHLLLEPDEAFYKPYLEPLLRRPGTKLLPESGIIWEQLNKILNPAHLPRQVERKHMADEEPPRNDTLLVSMNLCMYPKRKFRTFDSLAQLVLFQLVSSIRPGALFQKYGLVRMLIWLPDNEKGAIIPRTVQRRKKMAIESELATEYVCEIAGGEMEDSAESRPTHWYRRDVAIDMESTKSAIKRMRQQGFVLPPGRAQQHLQDFLDLNGADALDGTPLPKVDRPFMAELEKLEADYANGVFEQPSPSYKRLKELQYLARWTARRNTAIADYASEQEAARRAYMEAGSDKALLGRAAKLAQAWVDKVNGLDKGLRAEVILHRDNLHVLHQDPPVMNWDRRYVEPLRARPDEFFPQVPCCLVDIQPKAAARVLRDMGPGSTRGGDTFDLILRGLNQRAADPVTKALDNLYAGAGEGVSPDCPSLVDPALGGSPLPGAGELTTRTLSERQLVEIAEGWMKWPFRPSYSELVSRTIEDFVSDDGEEVTGNYKPNEA